MWLGNSWSVLLCLAVVFTLVLGSAFSSSAIATLIAGQRTESLKLSFKDSVVSLISTEETEKKQASGTIIDGCVLTAGRSIKEGTEIYAGSNRYSKEGHRLIGTAKVVKRGKNGIAVIQPEEPLPKALWQTFDVVTSEPFLGKENETNVYAIGWGFRETGSGTIIEKGEEQIGRIDLGEGIKYFGLLTYAGQEKGILEFNRAKSSQALAEGDEGCPIFTLSGQDKDQKVTLIAVGKSPRLSFPGVLVRNEKDLRAEDSIGSEAIDLFDQKKWLKETLEQLKCGMLAK